MGEPLGMDQITAMTVITLLAFLVGTILFLMIFSSFLGFVKIRNKTLEKRMGVYFEIVRWLSVFLIFSAIILFDRPVIKPVSQAFILFFTIMGLIIFIRSIDRGLTSRYRINQ